MEDINQDIIEFCEAQATEFGEQIFEDIQN